MKLKKLFFLTFIAMGSLAWGKVDEEKMAKDISAIINRLQWAERCERFVSEEELGEWGRHVIKSLNRTSFPQLYKGSADLPKYCPHFNDMTDEEKDYVWLMTLTAMAFYESSCKPDASARGPNGTAFGLLQLHLGREQLYADGCEKNDSKKPTLNLSCGLSMLDKQLFKHNRLFSQKSYWDVLRPLNVQNRTNRKATGIAWSLQLLPICEWKDTKAKPVKIKKP